MKKLIALASIAASTLAPTAALAITVDSTDEFYDQRDAIHRDIDRAIDARDYESVCLNTGKGLDLVKESQWILTQNDTGADQRAHVREWDRIVSGYANTCRNRNLALYEQKSGADSIAQMEELLNGLGFLGGKSLHRANAEAECNKRTRNGQIANNAAAWQSCVAGQENLTRSIFGN